LIAFSTSVPSINGGSRAGARSSGISRRTRKARTHAHLEDGQERSREGDLIVEARLAKPGTRDRHAQVITQVAQERPALLRILVVEDLHARQRIEEEMRLDLRLQQLQPRFGHLPVDLDAREARALELALRGALARGVRRGST
jgi:hypothetical protein